MYKILIIDDEVGMRSLLNEVFKKEYTVFATEGSLDALPIVEREAPHLAIVDKSLRGEDGLAVFEKIKAIHPAIQGLMLTGYGDEAGKREAIEKGFTDCLAKPFDIMDLKGYVKELLTPGVESSF